MTTETLPHWNLSAIFPGLDTPEFAASYGALVGGLDELTAKCDELGIARRERVEVNDLTADSFEQAAERFNAVLDQLTTLRAYVYSFVSTDSTYAAAQAWMSQLQQQGVRLSLLSTRFTAWLGSLDAEDLVERSPIAAAHAFAIRRAQLEAQHQMSPEEETLAAELELTGGTAWQRMYNTYSSQIIVPVALPDGAQDLPIAAVRNLATSPDRAVRQAGYAAELAAWQSHAVPIAAALNAIKGEALRLAGRRAWASPLDEALFNNAIDRATLDAMLTAAQESFPVFRRYLKAKARALGQPALAWYDMFAPVGGASRPWPYAEGARFITQQFGSYSGRLAGLAERAFAERWIDAEPRAGKSGGAFCMSVRPGESRILSNYTASFDAVSTLAHELGHAYHNLNLGPRTPLQRSTPMTLAETASIFCETIVTDAALRSVPPEEQITILEASLQSSCQVVVDITSRFLFEQAVFERRAQRDLSIDELCELMLTQQRLTYGDGLDQATLHPFMWAVKPHYYGSHFYNFPYMFGLLFGLGLFARYEADPEPFRASYDDLLSATGLGDAAELAQRYGIDLRDVEFWRASLAVIERDVTRFEGLVGAGA